MTDVDVAVKAITDRWATLWTHTPYQLGNEDFNQNGLAEWARLTVRHETGRQDTMGVSTNRRYLYGGRIFVEVFVRRDIGEARRNNLAQKAMDVFVGARFGGDVRVIAAIPRESGEDGLWSVSRVEFTFDYEQTR